MYDHFHNKNQSLSEQIVRLKKEIKELQQKNNAANLSCCSDYSVNTHHEMYDLIPAFYFMLNTHGFIQQANQKAFNELYLQHSDLEHGIRLIDIIPEHQRADLEESIERIFRGEDVVNEYELLLLGKENKQLPVLAYFQPLCHYGNIAALSILMVEFSEHKHEIDQLIDSKNRAESSDKLKSSFLANMSHEIRTPLNGIVGFAELLKDTGLPYEEKEEFLGIIKQSGNQLLSLINDIIDISKIEANQLNINKEIFSLNHLMEELEKIYHRQVIKSGKDVDLKLYKNFTTGKDRIYSDPRRLRQILTNLLSNALKFTNHGEIAFGYSVPSGKQEVHFFVEDTGVGIPKSKQRYIFERFAQVNAQNLQNAGGTGLGLAISKGILELLGGSIAVNSEPNEGSCFKFHIPLIHATEFNVKENKNNNAMNYNWNDKTLLIVEDDHINYKYLEILLLRTNVTVLRALDGQQAVDLCRNHPEIDVVLMDIQLPILNGYDATKKIKAFRGDLPIIAQTANAMDDDKDKCLNAGCDDYLTKPISHEVLFNLLDDIFKMKYHIS
jgi:signal transduction histidine kinase/CheY-like chemotaxis protein